MTNEIKPTPSGKEFYDRFKRFMDVKGVPYMAPNALDKDTNLYHAMLIILSYSLGITKLMLDDDERDDSVSPVTQKSAVAIRLKDYQNIRAMLNSSAMVALKDNEYTDQHENNARKECYDFLFNARI